MFKDSLHQMFDFELVDASQYHMEGWLLSATTYAKKHIKQFNCPSVYQGLPVISLHETFQGYEGQTIDVSGMDTSNVQDMSATFANSALEELNLNSWETPKLKYMSNMFEGSDRLRLIEINDIDTSNVVDMQGLFSSNHRLKTLDISKWDTSNVTNMSMMFYYCTSLRDLKQNFKIGKLNTINNMFNGCRHIKRLDLSSFGQSDAQHIYNMFVNCLDLEYIDFSNFKLIGQANWSIPFRINNFRNTQNIKILVISSQQLLNDAPDYLDVIRMKHKDFNFDRVIAKAKLLDQRLCIFLDD